MNIAFLAHDKKKELMVQFCTAYKSVLAKHNLCATATTGSCRIVRISNATTILQALIAKHISTVNKGRTTIRIIWIRCLISATSI